MQSKFATFAILSKWLSCHIGNHPTRMARAAPATLPWQQNIACTGETKFGARKERLVGPNLDVQSNGNPMIIQRQSNPIIVQ